jgi:hypothetical protein
MGFSITAFLNIVFKLNSGGPPRRKLYLDFKQHPFLVGVIPRPKPGGFCLNAIDYRLQHRLFNQHQSDPQTYHAAVIP